MPILENLERVRSMKAPRGLKAQAELAVEQMAAAKEIENIKALLSPADEEPADG